MVIMLFPTRKMVPSVGRQGADPDSILCGVGEHNRGLRLRVLVAQPRGNEGPLEGQFVLLDAGQNRHTETLTALVGQVTDAHEVLTLIRKKHPNCVSVVNANSLAHDSALSAAERAAHHAAN
jgi:hypothetical protein